ncbi:hypothetical protein [Frateuria aurantia]|uniref:DUF551 domain-containing protein n=1 Tax=Frateuria aurantia (strain ATCC 33424 / DSM 6220 / KCTC 2777 / LMG 1558 / NBRC 3245 / NCIMB 13370) TaxID=767434 RepID=H8L1U6_FRAAD|nr:hypothetical protein [Frateuria aurantia]AFC86357.1 hypothetical protein Fraau_1970 [Frateuria aurantia DSM 6220]
MTDNDKTLRDEFEERAKRLFLPIERNRFDQYRDTRTQHMWWGCQAAHAKYAPRWLPIDEEVKDGNPLLGLRVQDDAVCLAYWNDESFYNVWTGEKVILTHYLPIPGASEVVA